ncbi:MAG: endonuclease V [Candidatus Nanoarchaeia archaeon]|nr:endonuclease V [Candidatus Nanoarchaeia archaeon]MDD5740363.1 endonuclease V [Candidatus Nanoarchaeia archaeon]
MESEKLVKQYGIDLEKLEKEQIKLAEQLSIKDKIDFKLADKFGAFFNTFIKNRILSCVIVCDKNCEVVDRAYVLDKTSFPYLAGFRAYRELPAMILAFNKLNEMPDVVFISGMGIAHPRLGLASHFSISAGNIPSIGVSDAVFDCEEKDEGITKNKKKVGKILRTKPGSRPLYISPGNQITIDSSYDLCKKFIHLPHKLPEPMHLARKYAREVQDELKTGN